MVGWSITTSSVRRAIGEGLTQGTVFGPGFGNPIDNARLGGRSREQRERSGEQENRVFLRFGAVGGLIRERRVALAHEARVAERAAIRIDELLRDGGEDVGKRVLSVDEGPLERWFGQLVGQESGVHRG